MRKIFILAEQIGIAGFAGKYAGSLVALVILSGCATVDLSEMPDHERCVASIEHQICRCHQYRVSPEIVGRVSDSVNHPIEYCDKLVGFSPNTWVEYVVWFEETFDAVEDANASFVRPEVETSDQILEMANEY